MKPAAKPGSTGFDPLKLIQDHQVGLWRYLRALGCAPETADDLTQETFLIVLQRPFDDYNELATRAYLRKVAYNLLVTQQRKAGRMVLVENIEEYDRNWMRWAGEDDGEKTLEALRGCLKLLGARAHEALTMRFRDNRSRREIADALQITEDGAKNLMQRAKKALRDCVEGKLQGNCGEGELK